MLAHMNNVQPKADLPAGTQRYTNAMPHRSPKSQPRNLTGLYLGVDGDRQHVRKDSNLPKSRGRGMPSRRVQTPAEQKRYKKVEMLRTKEDKRGFAGNPVKLHQGRGLMSTDEMARANMYPTSNEQFWDVTKQTNRQFTAAPNSGVKHLEYLNPDPKDTMSSLYPKAFDQSLDDVLVEEIQQAVQLQKEVTGLIHCYNKICKGNSEALQSLLPNRPANASRPNTFGRTGFTVKSYRSPAQAEIESNFLDMERPKTVTGTYADRPLVPSPYFFKTYNPPKTAGHKSTSRQHNQSGSIIPVPGAGRLSQSVSRGRTHPSPRAQTPPDQPRLVRTTTMQAEEIIPLSPRQPYGAPMFHIDTHQDNKPSGRVDISLPAVHQCSPRTEDQDGEGDNDGEGGTTNRLNILPVIGVEEASVHGDDQAEDCSSNSEHLSKLKENSVARQETLTNLLDEHAQIVHEISNKEAQITAETNQSDQNNTVTNSKPSDENSDGPTANIEGSAVNTEGPTDNPEESAANTDGSAANMEGSAANTQGSA